MRDKSSCRGVLLSVALVLAVTATGRAGTTVEQFKALKWDESQAGTPLDLTRDHLVFSDEFTRPDVTADGGAGPWFAPVHSDFGAAHFLPPALNGPFLLLADGLHLRAQRGADGSWTSGLMRTCDSHGRGFAQAFGYFEMVAQFPPGPGSWPAFWLLSQNRLVDKTAEHPEIDVVEWYGGDPKGHHTTVHLWPADSPLPGALSRHMGTSDYHKLNSSLRSGELTGFHAYGVRLTSDWVIIYFDRCELARFPSLPEFRVPLYMLVNLAIFPAEKAQAASPLDLVVRQVRVYAPLGPESGSSSAR